MITTILHVASIESVILIEILLCTQLHIMSMCDFLANPQREKQAKEPHVDKYLLYKQKYELSCTFP